jgi:uncharacterized protein YycO
MTANRSKAAIAANWAKLSVTDPYRTLLLKQSAAAENGQGNCSTTIRHLELEENKNELH